MNGKVLLVVEDGTEYVEAFRRLAGSDAGPSVELVRAGDADEAKRVLAERKVDGVFLDVVFDRTPPEKLCGDSARGPEHLARQQGFYLAAELAELLPEGCRVVIAWDFTPEPGRLDALRKRVPALEGVEDGAPLSSVLASLVRSEFRAHSPFRAATSARRASICACCSCTALTSGAMSSV